MHSNGCGLLFFVVVVVVNWLFWSYSSFPFLDYLVFVIEVKSVFKG